MSSSSTFSFSHFLRLPPELRNQIWNQALPDIKSSAFIYKQDCWVSSKDSLSGEDGQSRLRWQPQKEEQYDLRFCYDFLAAVQLELPLLRTCQEARAVALTWAHEHKGVSVNINGPIKTFDPSRDVLCIFPKAFDEFCKNPYDKWESDLADGQVIYTGPSCDQWFATIKSIFMVVDFEGEPPGFINKAHTLQERWTLEPLSGEGKEGAGPGESMFYQKAAEVKRYLCDKLNRAQDDELDVRLVKLNRW